MLLSPVWIEDWLPPLIIKLSISSQGNDKIYLSSSVKLEISTRILSIVVDILSLP